MFRKLRGWFSPKPKTAEDVAAAQEAARLRAERETLRTGSLEGSSNFTHGGRESRGS